MDLSNIRATLLNRAGLLTGSVQTVRQSGQNAASEVVTMTDEMSSSTASKAAEKASDIARKVVDKVYIPVSLQITVSETDGSSRTFSAIPSVVLNGSSLQIIHNHNGVMTVIEADPGPSNNVIQISIQLT